MLYVAGAILVASGVFHLGVYALLDGAWEGPVSWRKPIEFGLSGGLTTLSLGLVMSRLPRTPWLAWPCAVGISLFVLETALIDLQRWRGVPSHFNNTTAFDSAVFSWMGIVVAFVSLGIFVMTLWTVVSLRGPASIRLAVSAGMVFLALGQFLGFAIIANGAAAPDLARASIVGAAGEMKLPHAVALHGLQVLGMLALLLERSPHREARRVLLAFVAIAGYALALGVATLQTFAGRAPLDLGPLAIAGALASAALLAVAYVAALRAAGRAALRSQVPAN